MGLKRPINDELLECPLKHARQLDYKRNFAQSDEVFPCHSDLQKISFAGVDDIFIRKPQEEETYGDDIVKKDSGYACKGIDPCVPVALFTKSSSDEEASGATSQSCLSVECYDLDVPQRDMVMYSNSYSLQLDRSPRKLVPLGPNHQADIPVWEGLSKSDKQEQLGVSYDNSSGYKCESRLMGTCIIPMPDIDSVFSETKLYDVGEGIMSCNCFDQGSVRCVQRHVNEARQELIETIGHEKFSELGFCDMGEEVAYKWSEFEESLFHEVVYSNPVSLGRDFWKHLAASFPYRTKKEIVSYYFNVFILHRRAVQNRCCMLDADSDDDEWHDSYGDFSMVPVSEEDDSAIEESPFPQDDEVVREAYCKVGSFVGEGDDDASDDDDSGDIRDGDGNSTVSRRCGGRRVDHLDKVAGSVGDDFIIGDDSCTSFELHPNVTDFVSHGDSKTVTDYGGRESGNAVVNLQSNKINGCDDILREGYLFETCDTKDWGARFQAPSTNGSDLLPTWNIVEQIFGQNSWEKGEN